MTYYHRMGEIPHKRHIQFRQSDGSLYHEEVMGIHGFAGVQSILYHLRPPTEVVKAEVVRRVEVPYEDQEHLHHRHIRSGELEAGGDAVDGRVPFMGNNDVVLSNRSVSRFHAYLTEQHGRFQIQDADSSNGTIVNRKSVAAQGQGDATELQTGDNVRVGTVELTFLNADALRRLVIAGAR